MFYQSRKVNTQHLIQREREKKGFKMSKLVTKSVSVKCP